MDKKTHYCLQFLNEEGWFIIDIYSSYPTIEEATEALDTVETNVPYTSSRIVKFTSEVVLLYDSYIPASA
jgi:hypothetical protein